MKLKGFLNKAFESGFDTISLSRSKAKLSKKNDDVEHDVLTIVLGTKEYCYIKHTNGVWTRWAKD